ncbi:hypothetical protein BDA99DRAFT_581314 [Phascolomyces articulosus]|uniref:Uncharacterized protein n=1 Tax=Phascolomyces articulosus TaxID=60185 RepID=A0AAD5PDD4_9FUNG|nr:hypothetical protein BDA99DRAFT_581314 [Phascolomyces articulosus]
MKHWALVYLIYFIVMEDSYTTSVSFHHQKRYILEDEVTMMESRLIKNVTNVPLIPNILMMLKNRIEYFIVLKERNGMRIYTCKHPKMYVGRSVCSLFLLNNRNFINFYAFRSFKLFEILS